MYANELGLAPDNFLNEWFIFHVQYVIIEH